MEKQQRALWFTRRNRNRDHSNSRLTLGAVVLVGAFGLVGCGASANFGSSGLRSDPLSFTVSNLPVAYVGEDYRATTLVTGGVAPYAYKLQGTLPEGLSFRGGVITGKPATTGSFRVTVEANDARLSNKVISYTLNVKTLPPAALKVVPPNTEIRGVTRVPVRLEYPRTALAGRLVWQLPTGLNVVGVSGVAQSVAFWKENDGKLILELGLPPRSAAQAISSTDVATITLRPSTEKAVPSLKLSADEVSYQLLGKGGEMLAEKAVPAPKASIPEKPTPEKSIAPAQQPASEQIKSSTAAPAKSETSETSETIPKSTPTETSTEIPKEVKQ